MAMTRDGWIDFATRDPAGAVDALIALGRRVDEAAGIPSSILRAGDAQFNQPTQPEDPMAGQRWLDTSLEPPVLKCWTDQGWAAVVDQPSFPRDVDAPKDLASRPCLSVPVPFSPPPEPEKLIRHDPGPDEITP